MPTYEYHCEKCDHTFEIFQSMKEKALATCPKAQCIRKPWGKGKVQRVIGVGAGLLFKGSGFYITDYRSEGYKEAARKETAPASSDGGSGNKAKAGGSEAKPAKASDSAKAGRGSDSGTGK